MPPLTGRKTSIATANVAVLTWTLNFAPSIGSLFICKTPYGLKNRA